MTPEAEAARDAYRLRRQMHQPKWNGGDPRWKVCWQKTADFVARHELDMDQYMDAQFELKAPFPMPNQLYSEQALTRHEAYSERSGDPLEALGRRLDVEMGFLETRKKIGLSIEDILTFPASPLTPLFCYCVALNFGLSELAEQFEEGAKRQLARSPQTREMYRALLPEDTDGNS